MLSAAKTGMLAVALSANLLCVAGPAEAVTVYGSCDQLHRTYKNGVAKSDAAADRQQRTDHYRPAVRPKVYRANTARDADKDGTACEVSR
jgi:predicted porin